MEKTLNDYFTRLEAELAFLDAGTRAEVISELRGHVEEKMKRRPKASLEDVLEELGSSEEIADKYRSEFSTEEPKKEGHGAENAQEKESAEERLAEELKRILSKGVPEGFATLKQFAESKGIKGLSGLKGLGELKEVERLKEDLADLGRSLGEMGRSSGIGGQIRGFMGSIFRGVSAVEDEETANLEVDAEGLRAVSIDLSLADIEVRSSLDGRIHVRYEISGGPGVETPRLVLEDGNLLLTERRLTGYGKRFFVKSIVVEIPIAVTLAATTRTGDVTVVGVEGAKTLKTFSGNIVVKDCIGELDAKSTSGDIEIRKVKGRVKASSLSGGITLTDLQGGVHASSSSGDVEAHGVEGSVEVKSISGDVEADVKGGFDGVTAESKSGDVSVSLPEKVNAELEAHAFHGDISVRVNGERQSREGGEVRLTLGMGGPVVRATTMSGDVAVRVGR